MNKYNVIVRTASAAHVFSAIAASSADAFEAAATQFADVPCGITVHQPVAASLLRKLITPSFKDIPARPPLTLPRFAETNFIFMSGAANPIPLESNDRRFMVVNPPAVIGQVR